MLIHKLQSSADTPETQLGSSSGIFRVFPAPRDVLIWVATLRVGVVSHSRPCSWKKRKLSTYTKHMGRPAVISSLVVNGKQCEGLVATDGWRNKDVLSNGMDRARVMTRCYAACRLSRRSKLPNL